MFKNAIVKKPSKMIVNGITSGIHGVPDPDMALSQHNDYISILKYCGLEVTCLNPDERFPDSVFIEDTAVIAGNIAIITNPGADSRKGEIQDVKNTLEKKFNKLKFINSPGTLDGGDVMLIEKTFYVGLSERTNLYGIEQFKEIVEREGFICKIIHLEGMLHLKTGVSYIGDNTIIVAEQLVNEPEFNDLKKIIPVGNESYASNSIRINEYVILPFGFRNVKQEVEERGFKIIESDVSEFRKVDGGLSCLSLRF